MLLTTSFKTQSRIPGHNSPIHATRHLLLVTFIRRCMKPFYSLLRTPSRAPSRAHSQDTFPFSGLLSLLRTSFGGLSPTLYLPVYYTFLTAHLPRSTLHLLRQFLFISSFAVFLADHFLDQWTRFKLFSQIPSPHFTASSTFFCILASTINNFTNHCMHI